MTTSGLCRMLRHAATCQEQTGLSETAVAYKNASVAIDQKRIYETELGDAGGNLRDLRVGVRAWVARVRNQLFDRLDFLRIVLSVTNHLRTDRASPPGILSG